MACRQDVRDAILNKGVYKIVSLLDYTKFYIGSSKDLYSREIKHFSALKYGYHSSNYLQNYYNSYGRESLKFIVLENCNEEDLIIKEQHYIDTLNPCFNTRKLAESNKGRIVPRESVNRQIESIKEFYKYNDRTWVFTKELCDEIIRLKLEGYTNEYISLELSVNINCISTVINGKCRNGKAISTFKKLDINKVKEIKKLLYLGYTFKSIANRYNINKHHVSKIFSGDSWKNVPIDINLEVSTHDVEFSKTSVRANKIYGL